MRRLIFLFSISLTLIFSAGLGCKGSKVKADDPMAKTKATLQKAEAAGLAFSSLSLSGKAQMNVPQMGLENVSVNYRVQIEEGKQIMIRITKLIEVARILLRPDSIFVMDRINRDLYACDYTMAASYLGDQASYTLIEDMLVGNFHPLTNDVRPESMVDENRAFTENKGGTALRYLINPDSYKLEEVQINNSEEAVEAKMGYSEFGTYNGKLFAERCKIQVLSPQDLAVDFQHRRIQIDEGSLTISFNVPGSYGRKACPAEK